MYQQCYLPPTLNHILKKVFKYSLFVGLTYNMRGYFASGIVFFRAMSKMFARIIC